MALYEHVTTERTDADGFTWIDVSDELVEVRCARCAEEAFPQVCPGDGRYHHHGCVHTSAGGFEAVCDDCAKTVDREWTESRILSLSVRETIDAL